MSGGEVSGGQLAIEEALGLKQHPASEVLLFLCECALTWLHTGSFPAGLAGLQPLVLPGSHSEVSGYPHHCVLLTPASAWLPFSPGCPRRLCLAKYLFTHPGVPCKTSSATVIPETNTHPSTQQRKHSSPRPVSGARLPPSHVFGGDGAALEGLPSLGVDGKSVLLSPGILRL